MKYGISTRRGLPVSVAAAGRAVGDGARKAITEFGPALEALAESEHEDERVDLVALAELIEYARSPLA